MVWQAPGEPVPNAERRNTPRKPSQLPIGIGVGRTFEAARSIDISVGGMLISRDKPLLSADTQLFDVLIRLPGDARPLRAVARTVWFWGPYQALRFMKMSEGDRLRLAEHIDRLSSERKRN